MPIEPKDVIDAKTNVRLDLLEGLRGLEPVPDEVTAFSINFEDSDLEEPDILTTSDALVAIPWAYQCIHSGMFLNIPPTYVQFELRGMTFVEAGDEDQSRWVYHRYIDYLGALHSIGVITDNRPALTGPEMLAWQAQTGH